MLTMILTLRMNHQKAAGRRHEASNQRREKENKNGGGLRVRYSSNNRIRRPECLLRRGRSRLGARASQQRGGSLSMEKMVDTLVYELNITHPNLDSMPIRSTLIVTLGQ